MRQLQLKLLCIVFCIQNLSAQNPDIVIPVGHTKSIDHVTFDTNSNTFLTCSEDGTAKLWDMATGKLLRTFEGHTDEISSVSFSADGKKILTSSWDGTVRLWDTYTGEPLYVLSDFENLVDYATFSPDETRLLVLSEYVFIYETVTGTLIDQTYGWNDGVLASYSPDGDYFILGGLNGGIKIFNSECKLLHNIEGHTDMVVSLEFSSDGSTFLSASMDGTIKIWKTSTGKEIIDPISEMGELMGASMSPDRNYFCASSDDGPILLGQFSTGEIRRLEGHTKEVSSLCFSPDGQFLLSASRDGTTKLWDISTGDLMHSVEGFTRWTAYAVFNPDGSSFLTISGKTVRVYDVSSGALRFVLEGHSDDLNRATTYSPDGKYIVTASKTGKAKLWDAHTGELLHPLEGFATILETVDFNSTAEKVYLSFNDGSIWCSGTSTGMIHFMYNNPKSQDGLFVYDSVSNQILASSPDGNARILNASTGEVICNLEGNNEPLTLGLFQPGGKILFTASKKQWMLWESATGKLLSTLEEHYKDIYEAEFSPDGNSLVLVAYAKTAKVWDPKTGRLKYSLDDNIIHAHFSPDGKYLVAISNEGVANVLDASNGEIVNPLVVKKDKISSACFNQDGTIIITQSHFGPARIWETRTGKLMHTVKKRRGSMSEAIFSSDGKYVLTVTGPWDNIPDILWEIATGDIVHAFAREKPELDVYSFYPAGDYILGYSPGYISRWDLKTKKYSHSPGEEITAVNDKMDLYITYYNPKIKFYRLSTGEELFTFIKVGKKDWVVLHPSGLFDASPGAMEKMYFVQGMEIIELEQLKERYYEPGVWAKVMGYNQDPIKKVDSLNTLDLYPEVIPYPIEEGILKVDFIKRGGGFGPVKIVLNNKELDIEPLRRELSEDGRVLSLSYDLNGQPYFLSGQENKIEVYAYNEEGWLKSRGAEVTYFIKEQNDVPPPHLYGIIAGVSNYKGTDLDLRFASKDASDFANALEMAAVKLLGKDNVSITLLNTDCEMDQFPYKENLEKEFEKVASEAKASDMLVVYLAGHGTSYGGQEGDFYFITAEASGFNLKDPVVRQQVAIAGDELTENFKNVAALKQVLIIDACHSGKLAEDLMASRSDLSSSVLRSYERMKDRTGMFIIAGSAADAVSYETSVYGQGLLTYSLLFGIKGAALREGEYVDVIELFQHSADQVPKLARGIGGIQRPQVRSPYGGQSFDIGRVTEDIKEHIVLSSPKPVFLRASFRPENAYRDVLGLSELINKELLEMSELGKQSKLVFVDAMNFPDGYSLFGGYQETEGTITVSVELYKGEELVDAFNESADTKEKLADNIINHALSSIPE